MRYLDLNISSCLKCCIYKSLSVPSPSLKRGMVKRSQQKLVVLFCFNSFLNTDKFFWSSLGSLFRKKIQRIQWNKLSWDFYLETSLYLQGPNLSACPVHWLQPGWQGPPPPPTPQPQHMLSTLAPAKLAWFLQTIPGEYLCYLMLTPLQSLVPIFKNKASVPKYRLWLIT